MTETPSEVETSF